MFVFVSRPMNIVTFLRKTITPQNGLLIFLGKETHSETHMEIVDNFDEKSYNNNGKPWKSSRIFDEKNYNNNGKPWKSSRIFDEKNYNNNGKPWKSSRILRVNLHFFIFLSFFFFQFFFYFLLFSFIFFHFLAFSFMLVHFLLFSFIFFHFLSFSLSLLGAQNLIFFVPQFRCDFS